MKSLSHDTGCAVHNKALVNTMTKLTTYAHLLSSSLTLLSGSVSAFQAAISSFSIPQRGGRPTTMVIHSTNEAETSASSISISSLSSQEILDQYDTFLLDMWGVLHNGSEPYEGVLEAVKELKREGKKMIILSNSSKRRENSHKMLTKRKYYSICRYCCLCCLLLLSSWLIFHSTTSNTNNEHT